MAARDSKWRNNIVQRPAMFSMGRCAACGTNNPTIPGEGLAKVCSGCGLAIASEDWTVGASAFTPPKIDIDKDENSEGVSRSTRARRRRNIRSLARQQQYKQIGGIGGPNDSTRKGATKHN